MAPKDLSPLYDAMWRLFMVGMSDCILPVGHLGVVLDIYRAAAFDTYRACPLPAHITVVVGGHRGKEHFLKAEFLSQEARIELAKDILSETIWEKYGVCIDVRADSVMNEVHKVITNILATKVTSHVQIRKIVASGDPKAFRALWFIKDTATMEFYDTVHQALSTVIRILRKLVVKPVVIETAKMHVGVPKVQIPQGLKALAIELNVLLTQQEEYEKKEAHYKGMIEHLQNKVNVQYGEIISRKESEAAALRKEVERLTATNRLLEKEVLGFQTKIRELTQYVARKGKSK